jgi:hypothetical protein
VPEGTAGPGVDGPDDEITIGPLPLPRIPVPRAVAVTADRIRRARWSEAGRRRTRRGLLLAALAVVAVAGATGALKLAGVIWTSSPPAWAAALGPGVTVTAPGQAAPGHGSPGAALAGYLAALSANDPATACGYVAAGPAARCTAPSGQSARNRLPYGVSVKTGYVAVDGTRALVGFTGKICSPGATPLHRATPACMANANPAAVFSAGNTFAVLWTRATSPVSGDAATYVLLPCVEEGGKWYVGSGLG